MVWILPLCKLKISWPRCFWASWQGDSQRGPGGDTATAEAVWPGRDDSGLGAGPTAQWLTHTMRDRPGPPLLDVNTRSLNGAVLATKMIRLRRRLKRGAQSATPRRGRETGRTQPLHSTPSQPRDRRQHCLSATVPHMQIKAATTASCAALTSHHPGDSEMSHLLSP